MPLPQMLETLRRTDVHPPLHHIVLWVTVRVLGTSELAVRTPSLLAATALIPVLYAAGRELYDRRGGPRRGRARRRRPVHGLVRAGGADVRAVHAVRASPLWMQVRAMRGGRTRDWVALRRRRRRADLDAVLRARCSSAFSRSLSLIAAWQRAASPRAARTGWLLSAARDRHARAAARAVRDGPVPRQRGRRQGVPASPRRRAPTRRPGAAPSVYAAITNSVWAVLGLPLDATMTRSRAVAAADAARAAAAGARQLGPHAAGSACAVVPAVGLFGLGQLKPFVFEVRYFIAAVPLRAAARRARASRAGRAAPRAAPRRACVAALSRRRGRPAAQRLQPACVRLQGRARRDRAPGRPGDVVVYSPPYLDKVVRYYGNGLDAKPARPWRFRRRDAPAVFVLGAFLDKPQYRRRDRRGRRAEIEATPPTRRRFRRPQIRVWEFR